MQRYDTVAIKATKTDEGFIRDAPVIGRSGIMRYRNADGSDRYEYRPPDEAFNADSMASIMGKPITVGHKAMANAGNIAELKPIGTVLSSGRQDGDAIVADVVIYDLPTAARELSCGYTLNLDETPGITPDGKHYDAIQRDIRYNHVAVVPKGRAGIARLNMDGDQDDDEVNHDEENQGGNGKMPMVKVRIDSGLAYDASPEVDVYVKGLLKDIKDGKANMDALQAKYDAAVSDLDKMKKSKADEDKKAKDNFDAAVKERVDMVDIAKKHDIKCDEMSNKDIKVAVINAVRGDSIDLKDKSDEYINAAYDMAKDDDTKESHGNHTDGIEKQRIDTNKPSDGNKNDRNDDDPDAALDALEEYESNLWMKGDK